MQDTSSRRSAMAEGGIVPVISIPQGFNEDELYVDLRSIFGHSLFLKCEGFNFAGSIKLKAATEMVEAAERDGTPAAGVDPGRVLVREPRRGAEHDRGEQGLPVPVRDRPALQPVDPAADGGVGQPRARRHRARSGRRLPRRADRLRPRAVRRRRPVRVAQPVHQPGNWKAHYRTTAPAIARQFPHVGRAVRRGRHHRDPDGLRPLLPGVAPPGADRRRRQRRLGDLRWRSRAAG